MSCKPKLQSRSSSYGIVFCTKAYQPHCLGQLIFTHYTLGFQFFGTYWRAPTNDHSWNSLDFGARVLCINAHNHKWKVQALQYYSKYWWGISILQPVCYVQWEMWHVLGQLLHKCNSCTYIIASTVRRAESKMLHYWDRSEFIEKKSTTETWGKWLSYGKYLCHHQKAILINFICKIDWLNWTLKSSQPSPPFYCRNRTTGQDLLKSSKKCNERADRSNWNKIVKMTV